MLKALVAGTLTIPPSPVSLRMHAFVCLLTLVVMMMAAGAGAFALTPTLSRSAAAAAGAKLSKHSNDAVGARGEVCMHAAPSEGAHGMRSRFLPIEQLYDDAFAPRNVQVAGALGEITAADVMAVSTSPPAEMGMWQYDFSDPGGPQMGTVAVQGSEVLQNMVEPVAIVAPNDELNVVLPENESAELLMIVDRVDREFVTGKFFLWNTPGNGLQVRYFESSPTPGYECVGRVGLVLIPFLKSMTPRFTGFEEEEY